MSTAVISLLRGVSFGFGMGLIVIAVMLALNLVYQIIVKYIRRYRRNKFLTVTVMKNTLQLLAILAKSHNEGQYVDEYLGRFYLKVNNDGRTYRVYVDTSDRCISGYSVNIDFRDVSDHFDGLSIYETMQKWYALDIEAMKLENENTAKQMLISMSQQIDQ